MSRWAAGVAALVMLVAEPVPAQQAATQVFDLPAGAHPHDVAPAPDGRVWYTAQHQGALGILDPATGESRHVPLGEDSAPHGVIRGPDGAAWITDGGQNAIVRYDPAREEVKSWPLPEGTGYANLNTAAFDSQGILWFTGQSGIYGRLDPQGDGPEVFEAPGGRGPYGITATPGGDVYYASLAGSHIARIDTATGAATVIRPPTPDQGARRIWSDARGRLWVSEWNSGQLSQYDPASGRWASWKLPGEAPRAYAVFVDEGGIVWVSDFGANAVLSFDPAAERFTGSYPGSAAGARVRQILGREGEVWLPESGTDRLMLVRTGEGR